MKVKVPVAWRSYYHLGNPRLPESYFRVNCRQLAVPHAIELWYNRSPHVEVDEFFEIRQFVAVKMTAIAKFGFNAGKDVEFYSLYAKLPASKMIYLKLKRS